MKPVRERYEELRKFYGMNDPYSKFEYVEISEKILGILLSEGYLHKFNMSDDLKEEVPEKYWWYPPGDVRMSHYELYDSDPFFNANTFYVIVRYSSMNDFILRKLGYSVRARPDPDGFIFLVFYTSEETVILASLSA